VGKVVLLAVGLALFVNVAVNVELGLISRVFVGAIVGITRLGVGVDVRVNKGKKVRVGVDVFVDV
jgi:hypothetical protein